MLFIDSELTKCKLGYCCFDLWSQESPLWFEKIFSSKGKDKQRSNNDLDGSKVGKFLMMELLMKVFEILVIRTQRFVVWQGFRTIINVCRTINFKDFNNVELPFLSGWTLELSLSKHCLILSNSLPFQTIFSKLLSRLDSKNANYSMDNIQDPSQYRSGSYKQPLIPIAKYRRFQLECCFRYRWGTVLT